MRTADFDYPLPEAAIAQTPVEPRHAARLLDGRDLTDHAFLELPGRLGAGDLVVVNRTRVRPARLRGTKTGTGGAVEALLVRHLDADRWEALVRPARRLRAGTLLTFGELAAEVLTDPAGGLAEIRLKGPSGDVEHDLLKVGEVPLPPYITSRLPDPERYQTMFAARPGSAAAPTAGLHFTPEVVAGLQSAKIELTSVDLEVGLATFRPIAADRIGDHEMHSERFVLDEPAAAAVAAARRRGGRVVAVGTTVVRVLESRATGDGGVTPGEGTTDLYLRPGSPFSVVDLLVTNFHLPRSSLLVLLAGFMGDGWRALYETALERGYRFLSFGDAMLAERA